MKREEDEEYEPKEKRVRKYWNSDDVEAFLNVWEATESELRNCKRNSHIYARMAKEMGDKFSPKDLKIKVKNFTQRYRSEKQLVGPSGEALSEWRYYNRVHKIYGSNVANSVTVDESIDPLSDETSNDSRLVPISLSSSPSTSTISPDLESPRKSKTQKNENALEVIKEQGKEHLVLFRQAVEDNNKISNEIVKLLQHQREFDAKILTILDKLVDKS